MQQTSSPSPMPGVRSGVTAMSKGSRFRLVVLLAILSYLLTSCKKEAPPIRQVTFHAHWIKPKAKTLFISQRHLNIDKQWINAADSSTEGKPVEFTIPIQMDGGVYYDFTDSAYVRITDNAGNIYADGLMRRLKQDPSFKVK